jgi:hypothetical protein
MMASMRFDTLADVELYIGGFVWTTDRFRDWQPWAVTLFIRGLRDDCDGAAVLGKWCLEQINIKGKIVKLWSSEKNVDGHAICFARDYLPGRHVMITNNLLLYINGDNWKQAIYEYFSEKYDLMQIGFKIEKINEEALL